MSVDKQGISPSQVECIRKHLYTVFVHECENVHPTPEGIAKLKEILLEHKDGLSTDWEKDAQFIHMAEDGLPGSKLNLDHAKFMSEPFEEWELYPDGPPASC